MNDRPTVNIEELRGLLGGEETAPRKRTGVDAERVHEQAVAALHAMRGLSKADKRRVLRRAEKLLDA